MVNPVDGFLQAVGLNVEHYITLGGILAPTVTVAVGLILGEVVRRWARRFDQRQSALMRQATLAAERSKPTGNGFADRIEKKVDWLIASHTDLTGDVRGLRVEVDHQGRRLDRHLDHKE
jgi:hypothetical protein